MSCSWGRRKSNSSAHHLRLPKSSDEIESKTDKPGSGATLLMRQHVKKKSMRQYSRMVMTLERIES